MTLNHEPYIAFGIDTHIGASSILLCCVPCAITNPHTRVSREDEYPLTEAELFMISKDEDADALLCDFCGHDLLRRPS